MSSPACRLALVPFVRGNGGCTGMDSSGFLLPTALRFTQRAGKLGIARQCRLFIIEALQHATLHLFTEDTFDAVHHVIVFTGNEREGIACLRSPAGAADPVRIRIGSIRHVVVDDVGYA